MESRVPDDWNELILGFEDLEPSEKARVILYLEENPEQASRLKRLQTTEALASGEIPIDPVAWDEAHLDPADLEAQQHSLRRILAAIEEHSDNTGSPRAQSASSFGLRDTRWAWALPLAAVLALAMFLPSWLAEDDPLHHLTVVALVGESGTRGAGPAEETHESLHTGSLHTGQAFALDFFLDRDSHVLVYHLDPAGELALVWPADPGAGPSYLRGGKQHRLPRAEDDEVWVLGPETGTESFLVASFPRWMPDCLELTPEPRGTDRAAILADLRSQVEACRGRVELIEFLHQD
jgi:hypothetical protein